jgi:hypothetical protein
MNLLEKFKETALSVIPVMGIVILLGVTVAPLEKNIIVNFLIGGILLIVGLTLFLVGVDIGILPIGERSGAALTAKRNLPLLLSVAFAIGVMVTIAEPDVQVLAVQIKGVSPEVNKWLLVFMIALGIGLFVMLGLLRTMLSWKLKYFFIISYVLVFILAFFTLKEFQGVAFDAGGATTGPMTVPFILALCVGVAGVRSSSSRNGDDSFGLTGVASIGPIAAVCLYGVFLKFFGGKSSVENMETVLTAAESTGPVAFISSLPAVIKEVSLALLPLVILFILFQIFLLKMPPMQIKRMVKGLIYSYFGLILFLSGANTGFMPAGKSLGQILGGLAAGETVLWKFLLIVIGMIFGAVVVCAEPAVWVLTEQVENVSGGTIKRKVMLIALSFGVALSIGLSMIRIIFGISIWYFLIPGYALALVLALFCPPLFTAIAFDSGGVASGPMTSTFVLSFAIGAASGVAGAAAGASATDAFGVIALVAMTPLIAIQILGLVYKIKNRKKVAGGPDE